MTLPDRVLHLLERVDADRAKAIVKLADSAFASREKPHDLVGMVPVSPTEAVIFVAYSRHLHQIPWLRLFEVAPARYLLSLVPDTPLEKLEITLSDLLETLPDDDSERELLDALRKCLREPRRSQTATKEEIIFVKLKANTEEPYGHRLSNPRESLD